MAFGACWSTSDSNYVEISTSPGAGDKPLNAYGDLQSQLEHLEYVLRAFEDELLDD